ncbi:hypothetical protein F5887DRAFT_890729 [Amanita rubescens]|nr:hypothetical protein F5887DRAFT_890729 [Amanita rubescens]
MFYQQRILIEDFEHHAEHLLNALLAREALPNDGHCQSCDMQRRAVWRCKDCNIPQLLCRFCMRHAHVHIPLHHIECWTGRFFRTAQLWEVGTYILVSHHMERSLFQLNTGKSHGIEMPRPAGTDDSDDIDGYMPTGLDTQQTEEVPRCDVLNNRYVRIIHTNGIHQIPVTTCTCRGTNAIHADLVYKKLVPASFSVYRTLFTVDVLDDFRLSNLECKVSAYQYFQKLRRLTCPSSPASTGNFYQELLRMSRLWRWLKKKKWAGHRHRDCAFHQESPGELANFCPACPQPGINLPDNWKNDTNKWVYRRVLVADGNFKADHVRQKGASDVWLSEGSGMFALRKDYKAFLQIAMENKAVKEKAPCQTQFRAIQLAMLGSKACDITGIVAIACARHGCFVPNSIANLSRGEQQKNVDWVLLQALKMSNMEHEQGAMLIYDIACQYFVHLRSHIGHLLPPGLEIDRAIGLFHVHGHKNECFFRFATSFIPGAGVTVGEILEMLWSSLNSITPTVRMATLPNRAETIDDHATDSNFKKLLNIVSVLSNRHVQAVSMVGQAQTYFSGLTKSITENDLQQWETEIKHAESIRHNQPAAMDILGTRAVDRQEPSASSNNVEVSYNSEMWIQLAIDIEEKQIILKEALRKLSKSPGDDDTMHIERLEQSITAQFSALKTLQQTVAGLSEVLNIKGDDALTFLEDLDEEDEADELSDCSATDLPNPLASSELPGELWPHAIQDRKLRMPSTCQHPHPSDIAIEFELRQRQACKHLQYLREAIAEKSFQYSHVIRIAPRKATKTRPRASIVKLNNTIASHSRTYSRCREALLRLGADERTLLKFRELKKEDLKSSTALLQPNQPGSTSVKLSWIWQTGLSPGEETAEGQREFQRVHWLRAQAQMHRWSEEVTLVSYEMQWTVRYFMYNMRTWDKRGIDCPEPGVAAYAARKSAMWHRMALDAEGEFLKGNSAYSRLL